MEEPIETIITASFTGKISTANYENSAPFFSLTEKYDCGFSDEELNLRQKELSVLCTKKFNEVAERLHQERIARAYKDIRFYTAQNGQKVPSVTSINNLDKEFNIPPDELSQYGSRGTLIHKQVEIFLSTGEWKEPKDVNERSSDYMCVVKGSLGLLFDNVDFRGFYKDYPFTVIELEKATINNKYKYGGRIDIICTIDSKNKGKWDKVAGVVYDEPVILDIKTSTSLDKTQFLTQQSAYAKSEGINHIGLIHLTKENKCGFAKPVITSNVERYWSLFKSKREKFAERYGV